MSNTADAANPLPFLLEEEAHQDHQATEAIFLTFTSDLGYFEARALGACMSAGARVCVIADAAMWSPDPYAIKQAGRAYHVGLARVTGAFHPKLAALVGPKRVVVAIGSGNLTAAGWQHNAETWAVIRGDTLVAPAALGDVADVFDDVADLGLDRIAVEALKRASGEIRRLLGSTAEIRDTGHRVLANTRQSILAELPEGKANEVWLYAPFHDRACRGVAGVITALQPERVTVMIQPGSTVVNPDVLKLALERSGVAWNLVQDADTRYRHGKLIEWATGDGRRWALTGSANLSYAALLAQPGAGNVEVCLLSPLQGPLFPRSERLDFTSLASITPPTGDQEPGLAYSTYAPLLTSAILNQDGAILDVTLSSALKKDTVLEVSDRHWAPDTWSPLASLPAGESRVAVPLQDPLPASTPVRLRPVDADIAGHWAIVFVTDPNTVCRRPVTASRSRVASAPLRKILDGDLALISALSADLAALAKDVAATRPPGSRRAHDPEGSETVRVDGDAAPWLWLLDQAVARHGESLASFGLGLPAPASRSGSGHAVWEEILVGDQEAGIEDDTAEALDAPDNEVSGAYATEHTARSDHRDDPEDVRRERRRRLRKWGDSINAVPFSSGLIVLRLALVWWCAGDWDEDDPEPHRLVSQMIRKLTRRELAAHEQPLARRLASLVVVALTVMADRVEGDFSDSGIQFRALRDEVRYLVLDVHDDAVIEYVRYLQRPSGMPLTADLVTDNARVWGEEDPLEDALAFADFDTQRLGLRLLRASNVTGPTERAAFQLADRVPEAGQPVGIWAVNAQGDWTFVSWARPDLIWASLRHGKTRWHHQCLPPQLGPLAANPMGDEPHGVIKHIPTTAVFLEAVNAMRELGLDSPAPPI